MSKKNESGLGELLRYLSELVERGAEEHYEGMGLRYRARYTPVLRAIKSGAQTVTEITALSHLTQGAISQAVSQMETDGMVFRTRGEDGRQQLIQLTPEGKVLLARLEPHWIATFETIRQLEAEIGFPLRRALEEAAVALQRKGFSQRLSDVKQYSAEVSADDD